MDKFNQEESKGVGDNPQPIKGTEAQGSVPDESFEVLQEEMGKLREALSRQEENSQSYLEQIKRLQADFENYRKRVEKEKLYLTEHASSLLVQKLLPVLDNFERALDAAKQANHLEKDSTLLKGIEMVHRQLMDLLRQEGLTPMEAAGKPFDPASHEAYAHEESPEGEEHQVLEEARKGYLWKGRVLRPALVKVSKNSANAQKKTGG